MAGTEKIFVGLDGYPDGWVAVTLFRAEQKIGYLDSVRDLTMNNTALVMIDMPIGLPDEGYRICDLEARNLLKPNSSRVFLGARRFILDYETQSAANAKAKSRKDKGVSAQLFCLSNKLRQVDEFMQEGHQDRILECHPELVFWRLNDRKPLPSKKKAEGIAIRQTLLEQRGFSMLQNWINKKPRKVKVDDIFDACACALAARDKTCQRPPVGQGTDGKGLRMEIHY